MKKETEKITAFLKNIREFHLWNFPDNLFIMLQSDVNDFFFKKMYILFLTQQRFSTFLGTHRQEINKYHRQIYTDRHKYYPKYFPLRYLKKCIPLLDIETNLYLEKNISEIRSRVGLSIFNPKFPIVESPEIYRCIAHVIADGSASPGKTPYYCNTNRVLLEQFKNDLNIFGEMKISETKSPTVCVVSFPKVLTDILAYTFDVKFSFPNRLPSLIFTASDDCKSSFTRALYDDEGTMSSELAISIHNVNLMLQLKQLIESMGIITNKFRVKKRGDKFSYISFAIPPNQFDLFRSLIGFSHPDKASNLDIAIQVRKRQERTRSPKLIRGNILQLLEKRPHSTLELANNLLLTTQGITLHLESLRSEGSVLIKGYRNKKIWELPNSNP